VSPDRRRSKIGEVNPARPMFRRVQNGVRSNVRKVFCIGMNKTGTSSLAAILGDQTELRATHDPDWTIWTQTSKVEKFRDYGVFSDGDGPGLGFLSEAFPDSLYVLNTRALRTWLISRYLAAERVRVIARFIGDRYFGSSKIALFATRVFTNNSDAALLRWTRMRNSYHRYALDFLAERKQSHVIIDLEGNPEAGLASLAECIGVEHLEAIRKNEDGDNTITGQIGDIVASRPVRESSIKAVDAFLVRTGLDEHAQVTEVIDDTQWFMQGNHVDALLRRVPALSPLQLKIFRLACHVRASVDSTVLNLLADQLVRPVRRELDPEGFLPIHRFSSGSA